MTQVHDASPQRCVDAQTHQDTTGQVNAPSDRWPRVTALPKPHKTKDSRPSPTFLLQFIWTVWRKQKRSRPCFSPFFRSFRRSLPIEKSNLRFPWVFQCSSSSLLSLVALARLRPRSLWCVTKRTARSHVPSTPKMLLEIKYNTKPIRNRLVHISSQKTKTYPASTPPPPLPSCPPPMFLSFNNTNVLLAVKPSLDAPGSSSETAISPGNATWVTQKRNQNLVCWLCYSIMERRMTKLNEILAMGFNFLGLYWVLSSRITSIYCYLWSSLDRSSVSPRLSITRPS